MSCCQCSDSHILLIAILSIRENERTDEKISENFNALYNANRFSVEARYPNNEVGVGVMPETEVIVQNWRTTTLSLAVPRNSIVRGETQFRYFSIAELLATGEIAQLAMLVDCFEYQACEWPEWKESKQLGLLNKARYLLLRSLQTDRELGWGTYA